MTYTIYNKITNLKLVHPAYGIWNTNSLQEAQEMLASCREFVISIGLEDIVNEFIITDLDSYQPPILPPVN